MPNPSDSTTPPGWEEFLASGERILWQGQPEASVIWGDLVAPESLAGLVAMAAGVAAIVKAGQGSIIAAGLGLVFVGFGLYLTVGRLLRDAALRRVTFYTLTDRAAFIATSPGGKRRLDRYEIGPATKATLQDGTPGSVWFASEERQTRGQWRGSKSEGMYIPPQTIRRRVGFRRIAEARKVYDLIAGISGQELAGTAPPR